ncbi:SUMF1/EgtB/PvdO family nonheme iron enzyme [Aquimarina sp. MMG016]|uniref:formylglycine-generating enzyme family protein n=1 Tax=Aquimarina sp. MMG016 TaxID=2822690 RepID=UPI001B3A2ED6|nr:SUMF1/EgtB/PvdO family nonheme iron enzyme [Aquimarina sp. MMG016]MBQ4820742.1 SUMF1/EgtB/PvdO family nonheme iron enzyme [Aquimarina sp. MMG016]
MKKISWLIVFGSLILYCCKKEKQDEVLQDNLLLIKGGVFINKKSNLYKKNVFVGDFYIGRFEVTQKEWIEIMGNNPSEFKADNLPVEMVSWYDCITYCIKKSKKDGLKPYYKIYKDSIDSFNKSEFDTIKWLVKINPKANGYRLPTEIEWEYAAGGGQLSRHYTYSGSNMVEDVAWYWRNCGDTLLTQHWDYKIIEKNNCKTHPVGDKAPNELGLYDMTGNVREWCTDWYENNKMPGGHFRSQRGGGWIGVELYSENSDRGYFEASGVGPDQGFRICRNKS